MVQSAEGNLDSFEANFPGLAELASIRDYEGRISATTWCQSQHLESMQEAKGMAEAKVKNLPK
jgi:hypothetical protein